MSKTNVRSWWFKPEYKLVHLVLNVKEPWSADNGGSICPEAFRKKYPRASLLTFGTEQPVSGWHPVLFSNPDAPEGAKDWDMREFWVAPGLLVPET